MTDFYPITNTALSWLEKIFSERFGHAWNLSRSEEGLRLRLKGAEGVIVFDKLEVGFTQADSDQPCTWWDALSEGWQPVIYRLLPAPGFANLHYPLIESQDENFIIHYDIPGLTYWMLARVEEICRTDLDNHERFPSSSSHAYKHSYLDRPVVDEWLDVLGQVILRQWPGIVLLRHQFQMNVSHDVDRPSRYGFANASNVIRRMAGDISRGDFQDAISGPLVRMNTKSELHIADSFNTFDWIMTQSEKAGHASAFYFICGRTSQMDGEYDIEHPALQNLMRVIHARGHEIGLHPSYNTYKDPQALKLEADRLRGFCQKKNINQDCWGGRMHYLRWQQPNTMRAWADAGMDYDSTLSYADHAGFRCGTCFEFPAYDAVNSEILAVRERPLIAMEASILSENYMGLNLEKSLQVFQDLKNKCQKVCGQFTLLWHNSELANHKMLYKTVIDS
jgi:hypothetical protein